MTKLLFIHGFGEDRQIWDDFLPQFEWSHKAEVVDYAHWEDCKSIAEYAQKIKKTLNEDAYVLVGHSMGGYIALELAAQFPEMVKGVVMVNSTAKADTEEKKLQRDKTIEFLLNNGTELFIESFLPNMFAASKIKEREGIIEQLKQRYKKLSNKALAIATESMKNRKDFQQFMQETQIPFLFIAGEEDSFFTPDSILSYLDFNGSFHSLVSLPMVGHHASYEAPGAVHYLISEFLSDK